MSATISRPERKTSALQPLRGFPVSLCCCFVVVCSLLRFQSCVLGGGGETKVEPCAVQFLFVLSRVCLSVCVRP